MWTEAEAKTKWCPFVRYRLTGTEIAVNRDAPERDEGNVFTCIASACMAWRWDQVMTQAAEFPGTWSRVSNNTHGHCGLAGKDA